MSTAAQAYIANGRLCIIGLHDTSLGPIPFAFHCQCDGPDGPVNVGAEDLDPEVSKVIDASKKPIMAIILREKMKAGAESLVERARAGDQNAMGTLDQIGKQRKAGSKKAAVAYELVRIYIRDNPTGNRSPKVVRALEKSRDSDDYLTAIPALTPGVPDYYVAALTLADGPALTRTRVSGIADRMGDEIKAFSFGFEKCTDDRLEHYTSRIRGDARRAMFTGHVVGLARTLQGVRIGKLPISALCPMAGWELGE